MPTTGGRPEAQGWPRAEGLHGDLRHPGGLKRGVVQFLLMFTKIFDVNGRVLLLAGPARQAHHPPRAPEGAPAHAHPGDG